MKSITHKKDTGFTLLELMVVVSIIGILASIAIPSYKNYILRTKVAVTLEFVNSIKLQISEALMNDRLDAVAPLRTPVDNLPLSNPMNYLNCVTVERRTSDCDEIYIEVWPNDKFSSDVRNGQTRMFILEGRMNNDGVLEWKCGSHPNTRSSRRIDAFLLPKSCQDTITRKRGKMCTKGKARTMNNRCRIGR